MLDSINNAARRGDLASVARQLEQGTPVDFIDNGRFNETALQIAAYAGHLEIVDYLLEHGANVDHQDLDGFGPVTAATRAGHWQIAKRLAEYGADFELYDGYGKCGMDYLRSCRSRRLRTEIEAILADRKG